MSLVPPSPAIASTVIWSALPVARRPAASPAAAAAVEGNATLTQGTSTELIGYMPPSTVRQLAGTAITIWPSSAEVIARRPIPMPHPAQARLPGSTKWVSGRFVTVVMATPPIERDLHANRSAPSHAATLEARTKGRRNRIRHRTRPRKHRQPPRRRAPLGGSQSRRGQQGRQETACRDDANSWPRQHRRP